ncbi:MAG: NAD-dependent epimerase/dehydratase family protein [Tepidisphaeraceae bacterium]
MSLLSQQRVFVTGATGYVGHPLAAQLREGGADVTVLSRAGQAQEGVRVVRGDLAVVDSYARHLRGCDCVVHCARSNNPEQDVASAASLLDAAVANGVRRFVHLSTISVYGVTRDGSIDETEPYRATGDAYATGKARIESQMLSRGGEIEVVVLQPANVYGLSGGWWSGAVLNMMRRGAIILVNDGTGTANMLHVLDLCDAIQSAVTAQGVAGQKFLLTDGRPMAWHEYFAGLERLIGREATLKLSADGARTLSRRLRDARLPARSWRWFRRILRGRPPVIALSDEQIDGFACRTVFRIDKARRVLGYEPKYDLEAGLKTVTTEK